MLVIGLKVVAYSLVAVLFVLFAYGLKDDVC